MAEEKPAGTPEAGAAPAPATPPPTGTPPAAPVSGWGRFGRWLKRMAIRLAIVVVLLVVALVIAEHQTSKPEFCGSCHIMKSYYESWHADIHGGKLGVACVECHYAPGEQHTVLAKMRGLSQLFSYVSGRYGSGRPRAHVDNRSCLTSKCHGDLGFMDKELALGTVKFVHAKHLQFDAKKREAREKELQDLSETLGALVGKERFAKLEEASLEAVPADVQLTRLGKMVDDWNVKVDKSNLERFAQLHHWQVRVAQLTDLQCTNCHAYGAPDKMGLEGDARRKEKAHADNHFSVKTTSCYTCHFNNEGFNTGTGSCLMCHTLPTKEILVHSAEKDPKLKGDFPKKTVRMDHQTILKNKVDCVACHADVASESAPVTRRDCARCHDRPEYFTAWKKPLSLDVVKKYHAVHVPEQRAKCLDCHSEIQHQLVRGAAPSGQPQFLTSVMADCTHCHPGHHAEQIKLLSGTGGAGVPKGEANLMFGSRTNCFGCHTKQMTTEHGGVTLRGAINGCVSCHGDRHNETFEKWKRGLKVTLMDAEDAYDGAWKMLHKVKDLDADTRQKADDLLKSAKSDLRLVKTGNGVHNVMYSIELLDSVSSRCQQAMALIERAGKKK
ncbi:MAG: NapC/NirT family cytochrome c [Gemmataceae bacterium]